MRRKDREVKDINKIIEIINSCKVLRLGVMSEEGVYIVPVNFGYDLINDEFCFYIHCATEGKKINCIIQNSNVCVEMDCNHRILEGEKACNYSYFYSSIIANGKAKILKNDDEKLKGLKLIMKHQTGKDFEIDKNAVKFVSIIKITAESISAKAH
ncbi:MAG: pyridoxamine 5'-phosphate oxidase family protein [Ruminococcus sp.]|nr:pyridoxamine 5'-phosphate oxidase family protein [Ruminococcus sp.]